MNKLNGGWKSHALDRYCTVNSPLHYYMADIALNILVSSCPSCIGLFITNADNTYAPTFVSKTVSFLSTPATAKNNSFYEVVLVDMVHLGQPFKVGPHRGQMDLGCGMISFSFFNGSGSRFIPSLPNPPLPQDYHDADYWFVKSLLDKGARPHVISETLFNHY